MSSPPPPKRARHEYGLMRPGASFVGSASGIHFVQTVYRAVSKAAGLPAHGVPGEDDQLPNSSPEAAIWQQNELAATRSEHLQLQDLLEWSQSYFDHWHPTFPFLHAPAVIKWLSELGDGADAIDVTRLDTMRLIIVRSIMSISLADSRQSGHSIKLPQSFVFQSYEEAIQSVLPVLIKRPSIESLQAAMSVQLFLISMLRLNGASRIHGIILRLILQMGLHRCPRRFQTFTSSEAATRQRIFWSAYVIDRYLSQCLGLPITLRDDDIDVCSINDERHTSGAEQESRMDDRLAFSCFIAKHARLKGEVIELCNKSISHRQWDSESFQQLNIRITKWTNEVEEYIECRAPQPTSLHPTQRLTLDALKHEIIISLNRPLLTAAKSSSEYRAAMQTCISASRSLIVQLHQSLFPSDIVSTSSLNPASTMPNFLFWPFWTWSVWISAFLILFAAVEKEVSQIAAVKLSDQSIDILKHMSIRGNVWANACAAAIRDLSVRFSERQHSNSEQTHANANLRPMNIAADPNGLAPTGPQRRPRAEESAQQYEQSNANFSSIPAASDGETDAAYGVYSNPGGASHGPDLDNTEPEMRSSLYPLNSGETSLEKMFSIDFGSEQTDLSLFEGFDIPFWIDDDEYASLAAHWDTT